MSTRFLHTRIRVSDLEKTIDWYGKTCGFQVLKRNDKSPAGNQIVHLELPGNEHHLELTYSPDYKVEVLARNEWGGYGAQPELLAAFSMPNDPAIDKILSQSVDLLRRGKKGGMLDGYVSGKRTRT